MSAGAGGAYPGEPPITVYRDLEHLAPKMQVAVAAALAECHTEGFPAVIEETFRSAETQALYYKRGRTQKPPQKTVTNAQSNLYSWHGYGLAVDVVHAKLGWDVPAHWFEQVAEIFKRHGMKWGGDWTTKDTPHFQWGQCKAGPSDEARRLMREGSSPAVWHAVGAD